MKNKYSIYLFFLFFAFLGCSQKNTKKETVNSSEDSLSVYFSLANDLSLSIPKRQEYNHKAFDIVVNQENDSLNRVNLFKVANRFYNLSNWIAFNKTVHLVLEHSEKAFDTTNAAKAYTYLGDYYDSQAVSDSAFVFYFKAEKMYVKLGDNFNLGKTLINKATLQYKESDFLGSEKAVFNALRVIKREKKANSVLYDAYNLLGLIYNELGEYENAMTYHNKALRVIDDEIIPLEFQSRATSYNNIGFLYLNLQKYKLAKEIFQKGLEQKNLFNQKPSLYAMLLDNLAYSRFKLERI